MAEFEVVCVDYGLFPHAGQKIIRYGIRTGAGVEVLEKEIVMYRMSIGNRYYVSGGGQKAYLMTATSPMGNTFLQTEPDSIAENNLGSLPVCTHDDRITYGTGVTDPDHVDAGSDGGPEVPSGGPDTGDTPDPG